MYEGGNGPIGKLGAPSGELTYEKISAVPFFFLFIFESITNVRYSVARISNFVFKHVILNVLICDYIE